MSNKLDLYRGSDVHITDKIIVKQPTIDEIRKFGDIKYFGAVNTLCGTGADFKFQLWQSGIDYTTISDYDLFLIYISKILGSKRSYVENLMNSEDEKDKEEFIQTVEDVLREQVRKGIDKKALKAGLNYYEFKYKEANYGRYPKGLMYGLQAFTSWLYDDNEPFMYLKYIDFHQTFR